MADRDCHSSYLGILAEILTPKLEAKGGAKSTLWFPNAGGIPIQLGWLDSCRLNSCCWSSAKQGQWRLELGHFCLRAELSAWGVWEEGSPLCISSMYPFWFSGTIWSSPFLQKAERKTESCLCVCNACLYKIVTKDKAKYYIRTWQWHRHYCPIKCKHLVFCKGMAMSGTAFKIPYTLWAPAFKFVISLWS